MPTIKIFTTYEEVINYKFPDKCVIKPTHMSGAVIIKKENSKIDFKEIKKWFSLNYYDRSREANYKTLTPKIIVEPIIFDEINLNDYKIFCYKGVPKLVQIDHNRYINRSKSFYKLKILDTNIGWIKQDFFNYQPFKEEIEKLKNLKNMIKVASRLSKDFEFIRVDLYTDNNKVYVGELTSICGNASLKFYPSHGEEECSKIIFE